MRTLATGSSAIAVNQPMEASAPIIPASSDSLQAFSTASTTGALRSSSQPPSSTVWMLCAQTSAVAAPMTGEAGSSASAAPRYPTADSANIVPAAIPSRAGREPRPAINEESDTLPAGSETSITPAVATRMAMTAGRLTGSPISTAPNTATCRISVLE